MLIGLFTLATTDGRRRVIRAFFLFISLVSVEVGIGGFFRLVVSGLLVALGVAIAKGYHSGQQGFDWTTFWVLLASLTALFVIQNILQSSMTLKRVLSPGAGNVWRNRRKTATAAILKRINRSLLRAPLEIEETKKLLTDLLDVIVLHVRDHRGSFNEEHHDVFANILLDGGEKLVVIARDSSSQSPRYNRQIPKEYGKGGLLCARAIEAKKPLSVGVVAFAYPEGPQNKPYKSILAIPLFSSDDKHVYGALSLDSSRPYFFESFLAGQAENQLENNLQPYLQLVTLVLESLVNRDLQKVLEKLRQPVTEKLPNSGEPNG